MKLYNYYTSTFIKVNDIPYNFLELSTVLLTRTFIRIQHICNTFVFISNRIDNAFCMRYYERVKMDSSLKELNFYES